MFKRPIIFLILFTVAIPALSKAEEISLTLNEAVVIALRDNRDVMLKAEEVKKAKSKIEESKASLFPSLDFLGGYTRTVGLSQKPLGVTTTQTTISQILYQGGKIINTIKYNKNGLDVVSAVLDKQKLETALSVKKTFYTILLSEHFVELNKSIFDNSKEHLQYLEARFRQGESSESDILRINESLSSVEEAYEASLNQFESAQVLLRALLYLGDDVTVKPDGEFAYQKQDIIYDEAFLKAMKDRPEIRQYEAQLNQAKNAIDIAKAGGRPTITGSWEYFSRSNSSVIAGGGTVTGASSTTSSKNWNDYSTLGFVFSWPVFDGWLTKSKVEQAIVDLKQAQLLKEKTAKDISTELKNAYISLKNAIAGIKTSESELAVYSDNFQATQQQKQAGIASFLDLDDAELMYNVSVFNKNQAVYDYIIAKLEFDKATGGL